ncbi:MAG: alpha amylase C-terminal domain-containing protein, partial [Halioglobus sp.]|nr:alpha amylase C-terminal domain-containing protein [Halioglobus sp.]
RGDFDAAGFEWIDCHDSTQSVLSYLRRDHEGFLLVILNFTPVVRENYRIGVPEAGTYREIFNSDSRYYGGSDVGNPLSIESEALPWMERPVSLALTLPPLGALILRRLPHP